MAKGPARREFDDIAEEVQRRLAQAVRVADQKLAVWMDRWCW
jgi:hypothetical protein